MNIVLVGFYGHGNFGDDVLFRVTHRFVRTLFPQANIAVQSEARDPKYLDALVGEPMPIVRLGDRRRFDLAVHGGGGNFFDFTPTTPRYAAINWFARTLGPYNFAALYRFIREITGKIGVVARHRIALGLGIGTYSPSARRLLHELPVLAEMDFLGVRDPRSIENLRDLGLHHKIHRTGDLAFAGGWGEGDTPFRQSETVTVVLRKWRQEEVNKAQLDSLKTISEQYAVRVLLLDREADRVLLPALGDYDVITYEPGEFGPVIAALGEASAIVTSRAHGAICGAMLGTPSLLLPIEPKLHAVHSMLPSSTIVPGSAELLNDALDRAIAIRKSTITADVVANRTLLKGGLDHCSHLLLDKV